MFGHHVQISVCNIYPEEEATALVCDVSVLPVNYDITCDDRVILWMWFRVCDKKVCLQIPGIHVLNPTEP